MRFLNDARVALFNTLRRRLPENARAWIRNTGLAEPVRNLLFGPLVATPVTFGGHQFEFVSPVKTASAVRSTGGIENGLCRLILQECQPGSIAIDVGANYGFVTLVMAQAVGSSGQVHSFEADASIHRALVDNVSRNGLRDRCTPVHGFVGDVARPPSHVTIDAYVAERGLARVDFIKIDVDGPDLEVLLGARETLARFHPIIAIEMTGEQQRIITFLQELGYECTDMRGRDVDPAAWPPNVLAAVGRRLAVPRRTA